ncbi:alpha-ketoglutarate decarboxylase [Dokdonia sp. Dokd-P16]|uniref:alpha-ketoglutarate decarboxylase n=1 Tax=Dokdonia sp. Dokd-P16 TaxID=2173169 RepID=UPI001EF27C33|nr:alpha-ketoglutarate decarboxylase [Dokdonia sp. Dokd-P16]
MIRLTMRERISYAILVLSFLFLGNNTLFAQQTTTTPKSDFWSKVRFGGGLGLNFGRNNTNITVAPSALYQPNQYVAFGPGLNYTYQKFGDFKTTLVGASAIVISNPLDFLQLSGEFEQLRVFQSVSGQPDIPNSWNTALFLGAGYRLNVGGNSLGAIGVRYNVLFDNDDSVYADAWQPFVRVYF